MPRGNGMPLYEIVFSLTGERKRRTIGGFYNLNEVVEFASERVGSMKKVEVGYFGRENPEYIPIEKVESYAERMKQIYATIRK